MSNLLVENVPSLIQCTLINITFEMGFSFIPFDAVCNVTSKFSVSVEMRRTVVSQGLAYQQPMDDSGQEHHVPMLLNDGREVPKFLPDKTAFGK